MSETSKTTELESDLAKSSINDDCETNHNFENPNYRKLYAKISMDAMIGVQSADNGDEEAKQKPCDDNESSPMLPTDTDNPSENDLEFFYDDDDDDEDEFFDDDDDDDDDEYDLDYLKTHQNNSNEPKSDPPVNKIALDYELPDGWERHEDELGPYFWHIPTGTIQRERPYLGTIDKSMIRSDSLVFLDKSAINVDYNHADLIEEEPEKKDKDDEDDDGDSVVERKALISKKKVIANMRLTFPTDDEDESNDSHEELSFVVHSLGWLDVDESQVNSQTGSLVIKRCIHELSNRTENAARCWGPDETQSLILRLGDEKISLLDPTTETILSIQLIREIRMWAVDEQNNFAYVVKERHITSTGSTSSSCTLKCHVFHCDEDENRFNAQQIAIYLKDALVQIKNRYMKYSRPNQLGLNSKRNGETSLNTFEFPTPIEEPKKMINALYMGFIPVSKPMGVDILNVAIDEVVSSLKMSLCNENSNESELMRPVCIHISPSNIIVEDRDSGATLVECRVR